MQWHRDHSWFVIGNRSNPEFSKKIGSENKHGWGINDSKDGIMDYIHTKHPDL